MDTPVRGCLLPRLQQFVHYHCCCLLNCVLAFIRERADCYNRLWKERVQRLFYKHYKRFEKHIYLLYEVKSDAM